MTILESTVRACDEAGDCTPICAGARERGEWPTLGAILRAREALGINPFRFLAQHEAQLATEAH